jgi:hypothetical protein
VVVLVPLMAQLHRVPNLEAQREAIKKLGFLVGKWAGEARPLRGPTERVELLQTEEAQYNLGGVMYKQNIPCLYAMFGACMGRIMAGCLRTLSKSNSRKG